MSNKMYRRAIAVSATVAAGMLAFTAPAFADNVPATPNPCEVTTPGGGNGGGNSGGGGGDIYYPDNGKDDDGGGNGGGDIYYPDNGKDDGHIYHPDNGKDYDNPGEDVVITAVPGGDNEKVEVDVPANCGGTPETPEAPAPAGPGFGALFGSLSNLSGLPKF